MNKICTDIKQSKILAEILPIESADLWYAETYEGKTDGWNLIVSDTPYYSLSLVKPSENNYSQNIVKDIPCWSLSALLEQLHYPSLHKTISGWRCDCYNKDGNCFKFGINAPTEVDACVKLIELLQKENLI